MTLSNAKSSFQVTIMKTGLEAIMLGQYIRIIWQSGAINCGILVILSRDEFQTNKDISSHLSPVRMQYDCISVQSDCGQWEDLIRKNWEEELELWLKVRGERVMGCGWEYDLVVQSRPDNWCSYQWCMVLQYNWSINSEFLSLLNFLQAAILV